MNAIDQGPFGHWHEQYETEILEDINWILSEAGKAVAIPRTVAPPLIIEYQNYNGHRPRIDRKPQSQEVPYGGGHHVGKAEAAKALRNQFAFDTAASRIKTFFNLPEEYQGQVRHILHDFQDAITPRTEEVFLTFAELVDPINGRIRLCLHRIEDPKGQEISPGRWIENYPVTRWRALALKVQR